VHLPPAYEVTVRAACAIRESLPVQAILEIVGADGTSLCSRHIFNLAEETALSLVTSENLLNPLTVCLRVSTLMPLGMGERAVIDLSPIKAVPAKG
jgi:hypothetical protein